MACKKQTFTVRRAVFSDGSTSSQFITFYRIQLLQWRAVRATVILEGSSGALTVSSAVIYSNTEDGFASATPVDLPTTPTTRTADGTSFGASYFSLDTSKQMAEIGIQAKNTSGTKRQMGTVTLIIDLSEEG